RAIDAAYISYIAVGADGQVQTGVVASESGTSITLRQPEGKSVTLLREEIEQLRVSDKSLMPEAIERSIPPQEMADLIGYIKGWRYLDGSVPLP
ncbi:MAG: hypothetical protein KDA42_02355, partial [Planctomycetales bacterium]|nr:hypothetical protein [Planctomycetales bacterium]